MSTNFEKFTHFKVRCKCNELIDFSSDNTEVHCSACHARITIKYLGHNDSQREIVEKTLWAFVKKINTFRFSVRQWTKKEQEKRFNEFHEFSKDIYDNHLSAEAKLFPENKQVRLVTFYADKYLVESDPYDITTEIGFSKYLFNCVTFQNTNFVFSPLTIDCPAVYEININGSEKYYIVHYISNLTPLNKDNFAVTTLAPADILFEYYIRTEVNHTYGADVQWQLTDGQLAPIKSEEEDSTNYFFTDKRFSKINSTLGAEIGEKLKPLLKAKKKYTFSSAYSEKHPESIYCACTKAEIISELRNLGLLKYESQLFEILTKGSDCFVVTACLGEENHPDVILLKSYRDKVLYKTFIGRYLIRVYEIIGPRAARVIRSRSILRKLLTKILIKPAVFFVDRRLKL